MSSTTPAADLRSVTVCVVTYDRPAALARMLDSIAAIRPPAEGWVRAGTVVVDNHPEGTAREVVEAWAAAGNDVRYVIEPEPGISAARNRAIAEATGAFVAFADDDDRVSPQWLYELTRTQQETGAEAVVGRKVLEFEEGSSRWAIESGVFEPEDLEQGQPVGYIGAGLLMVTRDLPFSPPFDPRFGLLGGEDDELARRLLAHGGRIVHARDAVVHVWIPADRTRFKGYVQREIRAGSSLALIELSHASSAAARWMVRLRSLGLGLAKVVAGTGRVGLLALSGGRKRAASGVRTPLTGIGMVAAAVGRPVAGYSRPPTPRC